MIKSILFVITIFSALIFGQNAEDILSKSNDEVEVEKVNLDNVDLGSSEDYGADTIDSHTSYIASKFGDTFFEEWQLKYLRSSLIHWLKEKSLKYVYIDLVNTKTRNVDFRTKFDIQYSDHFRNDLWRDLSKLRRDVYAFSKENSNASYKVKILVGFYKNASDVDGWETAKNYPTLNEESQTRVQSHNAVEVGGIRIDASTVGIVLLAGL